MKKFVTLVLSLLMMLPLAGGVAAKDAATYNLSDVTNALKYVAGWGDGYYSEKYDYNTDNKVSIFDAACMLKVIAGWDEDNICLKKPTDEFIRQIEVELEVYHANRADPEGRYPGINYDVEVHRYYGTYNGAAVIYYEGGGMGYTQAYMTVSIAGYEFSYPDGHTIEVWKDGELYSMNRAYEKGILSKNDVAKIADYHRYGGYIKY
ncbi:MAG: hypothetical protein IJ386_01065 [Clostridia bacterium]|nr:hypothetical protein [Clostridia bacterium]